MLNPVQQYRLLQEKMTEANDWPEFNPDKGVTDPPTQVVVNAVALLMAVALSLIKQIGHKFN